jgi:hypothetical protein
MLRSNRSEWWRSGQGWCDRVQGIKERTATRGASSPAVRSGIAELFARTFSSMMISWDTSRVTCDGVCKRGNMETMGETLLPALQLVTGLVQSSECECGFPLLPDCGAPPSSPKAQRAQSTLHMLSVGQIARERHLWTWSDSCWVCWDGKTG